MTPANRRRGGRRAELGPPRGGAERSGAAAAEAVGAVQVVSAQRRVSVSGSSLPGSWYVAKWAVPVLRDTKWRSRARGIRLSFVLSRKVRELSLRSLVS